MTWVQIPSPDEEEEEAAAAGVAPTAKSFSSCHARSCATFSILRALFLAWALLPLPSPLLEPPTLVMPSSSPSVSESETATMPTSAGTASTIPFLRFLKDSTASCTAAASVASTNCCNVGLGGASAFAAAGAFACGPAFAWPMGGCLTWYTGMGGGGGTTPSQPGSSGPAFRSIWSWYATPGIGWSSAIFAAATGSQVQADA